MRNLSSALADSIIETLETENATIGWRKVAVTTYSIVPVELETIEIFDALSDAKKLEYLGQVVIGGELNMELPEPDGETLAITNIEQSGCVSDGMIEMSLTGLVFGFLTTVNLIMSVDGGSYSSVATISNGTSWTFSLPESLITGSSAVKFQLLKEAFSSNESETFTGTWWTTCIE